MLEIQYISWHERILLLVINQVLMIFRNRFCSRKKILFIYLYEISNNNSKVPLSLHYILIPGFHSCLTLIITGIKTSNTLIITIFLLVWIKRKRSSNIINRQSDLCCWSAWGREASAGVEIPRREHHGASADRGVALLAGPAPHSAAPPAHI